jgi:hypothetical protein
LHDVIVGLITAGFSLIVGITLWSIEQQSKDKQIKELQNKVDSIEKHLYEQLPDSTKK